MSRRPSIRRLTPLAACLLAAPSLLLAQDVKPATKAQQENETLLDLLDLLNTPVTTATKTAVKLSDVPAAVTVISRQDIQHYGYQSLDQALSRVPEVYTHYEGHDTGADFRGFFANNVDRRVLYLINGQRINDRFHFGDFIPDTIQDLSNVEQIEVIRGPGAALYGSVAVLGVVNIITRNPLKVVGETNVYGSMAAVDVASGSLTKKITAGFQHCWSNDVGLSVDLNWFDGDLCYDTRTQDLARPWYGPNSKGFGLINLKRSTDFYLNVPGSFAGGTSFGGGNQTPSFNIVLKAHDFTVGAILQTHLATWAWPNGQLWTVGNPDNIRSWGTGALYLDWKPKYLEKWDFAARLSYNINTNREVQDYAADQYTKNADGTPTTTSLFMNRIGGLASGVAFIGPNGERYTSGSGIDSTLISNTAAMTHGGGGHYNYAGIDKSWGLDFQMSPIKTNKVLLSIGGNYEKADYVNKQWASMRDGTFILWANGGGIKDKGYYYGLWAQIIWTPVQQLTITGGARYDKQIVQDVYRELGGDQMIYKQVGTSYTPIRFQDRASNDFTPRIAINWRIDPTSNLKFIYAEAFRAVPPQEIIRLPLGSAEAESEKTKDFELLYSTILGGKFNFSANAFLMKGNVVYAFNPAVSAFSKGSGWSNTGLTVDLRYLSKGGLEAWFNGTYYSLKRASDAFSFMKNYNVTPNVPLPNMEKPLDSPTTMAKAGASYRFMSGTTVSGELYYNGEITSLTTVNLNVGDPNPGGTQPNYLEHKVPSSTSINVAVRQDLDKLGMKGAYAQLRITNMLDAKVWGVMNMDMQGYSANTYGKPTQLPGFGRLYTFQLGFTF